MKPECIYHLAGSLLAASPNITVRQALTLALHIIQGLHRMEELKGYEEAAN